jgi:hypothetical protein
MPDLALSPVDFRGQAGGIAMLSPGPRNPFRFLDWSGPATPGLRSENRIRRPYKLSLSRIRNRSTTMLTVADDMPVYRASRIREALVWSVTSSDP